MAASPSTDNYYIGKGEVTYTSYGDSEEQEFGNVTALSFTPNVTFLDHFSSRTSTRTKDKSVVQETGGTLTIVGDEFTADNLRLGMMGGAITDDGTDRSFKILDATTIELAVTFTGTNAVGEKFELSVPKLSVNPTSEIQLISDEWGTWELTCEVLYDDATSQFGTMKELGTGTSV